MQRTTVHQSQGLAGTERYGAVHGTEVSQILPSYVQAGTEPAPPSGVAPKSRLDHCTGFTERGKGCTAPKAKGTEYCVGHLRKFGMLEKKEEIQE